MMDKEDDLTQEGDVGSDNDSVDSIQLLADITDVINSYSDGSNVDLFGRKDTKAFEEYPHPAGDQEVMFTIVSDDKSLKSTFSQDVDFLEKQEKPLLEKDQRVERLHNDPNDCIESKVVAVAADSIKNAVEQPALSFISQQKYVPGDPKKDPFHITLKEPVIRLMKLDPDIKVFKVESVTNVLSDAHLHSVETEHSIGEKKACKQGEVKKSVCHDESSPLSDLSMSEVSIDEDKTVKVSSIISLSDTNTVTLKTKEEKIHVTKYQERDKISKILDKNPLLDSGHHKTIDTEISPEKLKAKMGSSGTAYSSAAESKNVHPYNNSSSQTKKNMSSSSGARSNNATNKSKAFETCLKNTEKNIKVAEKSKKSTVSDSRKRTLSKDDRGIEASSHSCNKNPKRVLKEDRKVNDIKNEYDWCFELHLTPFGIEDLSDESFRKFVNLASDCAISFDSHRSGKSQGHVHLYFGSLSNMQSGMHKLSQLSLMSPKALHGIIKCSHIKPTSGLESNFNWKSTEENWKQDEETKRKCAQVQRIPPFVSKEMISLLFPFSLNVHSPKPNTGDQKKYLQGHTEVEFENTAWMETVLSCFRDLYVAKVGSGNSEWRLVVTNFKPPIEKIPEPHVTSSQSNIMTKDTGEPKMSADLARRDMFKGRTADCHNKVKCSDGYQSQLKEPVSDSGKGGCRTRKRPFRLSDNLNPNGATAEKKSKILDETHVVRNVDQIDGSMSQNSATDKDHLRLIAQAKGFDPDNVDVIRILEVQNQLTSLQALFSSTMSEERASLPLDLSHSADIAQGRKRSNADLNSRGLAGKGNMTISAAEQQLRENIAMKQKQLKELEEKLQWKRENPKVKRQIRCSESITQNLTGDFLTEMEGSKNNMLLGQNDEPLDFTKPAPKIEEAVKKDEERSKMLAVKSSTPQQSQGNSVNSLQSANSADDFALPLQFGKNVKKTVTDIAATEGKGILRTLDRPISESYRGMKPPNKNVHSPGNRIRENEANRVFNANSRSQAKSEGRETLDRDRFFVSLQPGNIPNIASFHDSCSFDHQRSKQNLSDDYRRGKLCRGNTSYRQFHESKIDKESVRVEMQWRGKDNTAVNNVATYNPSTLNEMDYNINKRQYKSWKSGNGGNSSETQQRIPDESFHASFKGKHREDFQSRPEEMESTFSFKSDPGLGRDSSYSEQFSHLGKNAGPADYRQRNEQANPREIYRKNHQQAQHPGSSNILWEEERMFEDIDGLEQQHRDLRQRQNINVEEGHERLDEGVQFQGSGLRGRGNALRGSAIQTRDRATRMRGRGVSLQRDIRFSGEDWDCPKASEMRFVGLESQSKVVIAKGRELHQSAGMTGVGIDPHIDASMRKRGVGRARRGMEHHRNDGMRGRTAGMTGTGVEPQRGPHSSTGDRDPETITPRSERGMEMPNIIGHARGRGDFRMRGRSTGQQRAIEMSEQNIMEPEIMTDSSERGIEPLLYRNMNMRGRGIELQRGIGLRGRDLKIQRGSRIRGRGRDIERDIGYQKDIVMNRIDSEPCRNTEMSGKNRESQSGIGLRGRGMHIQRSLEIKERGIDYQENTVLGHGRGFPNISNLSDVRGKQNLVREYEIGIERSFTESHEEATLAGVSLGGRTQGTRGRGPSELHGYKEGAVQRGRGRGLDHQRGGSVSRGKSYGNRYSNMPEDLNSEQDASLAIDHLYQGIRSKLNQDPEESFEYSQNVPLRTNIGRQGSFSNAPSQRRRGTGRGFGVPQRGNGYERHPETPQRGVEVDRSFWIPQRAGGVDGHLGPPQRGGGVDRHIEPSQRGGGVDRYLGSSQRGGGVDRHIEPSQRGGGIDRHLGSLQRGGEVERHTGTPQRGGRVDRQLRPSQRGGNVDRHPGPLQRGGKVERHHGTPHRGGRVDRHLESSQRVDDGGSFSSLHDGSGGFVGNFKGRENLKTGHSMADGRG